MTARKLGRRFVAVEQNGLYCAWAQKRLEMALENSAIQGYSGGVFWERNTAALQKRISMEENSAKQKPTFSSIKKGKET